MDFRADRAQKAWRDDRARRIPGNCGRPGPGQDRSGPSGVEKTGFRDVRGGRETDGPQGIAGRVHAEPGCRIASAQKPSAIMRLDELSARARLSLLSTSRIMT